VTEGNELISRIKV